jgi:hypothetical protein
MNSGSPAGETAPAPTGGRCCGFDKLIEKQEYVHKTKQNCTTEK